MAELISVVRCCLETLANWIGNFNWLHRDIQLVNRGIFRPSNNRLPPGKRSFALRQTVICRAANEFKSKLLILNFYVNGGVAISCHLEVRIIAMAPYFIVMVYHFYFLCKDTIFLSEMQVKKRKRLKIIWFSVFFLGRDYRTTIGLIE